MQDPYNTPNAQQPQQPFNPQQPMMPQQTDGFAITSMVLGILSLLLICVYGFILAIPGLVFGHISINKINRNPVIGGKGMAVAGVVCSYVSIGISIVMVIIAVFFTAGAAATGASIIEEMEKQNSKQPVENFDFNELNSESGD